MNTILFDTEDAPYLRWMERNPAGFVLNTGKRETSGTAVLHKAGCFHIANFKGTTNLNPFTAQEYIKVCANDAAALRGWCRKNRPNSTDFSKICGSCKPI